MQHTLIQISMFYQHKINKKRPKFLLKNPRKFMKYNNLIDNSLVLMSIALLYNIVVFGSILVVGQH